MRRMFQIPLFFRSILILAMFATAAPACSSPSTNNPDASHGVDVGASVDDAGHDAAVVSATDAGTDAAAAIDMGTTLDGGHDAAATLVDADMSDAGGSLGACGGRGGATCSSNEYCDYDDSGGVSCGAADGGGVCRARPANCGTAGPAVCGCDRGAYANACLAAHAGVDTTTDVSCLTP